MRTLPLLAAAALLAACQGEGARIARPEEMALEVERGFHQIGPVLPDGNAIPGEPTVQQMLPQPVLVRVTTPGALSLGVAGTGPSAAAQIPSGAVVHWNVVGNGCGEPVDAETPVEGDSAYTLWRRGTKAGVICKLAAVGRVDGVEFGTDTATAEFTPGNATRTFRYAGAPCDAPCTVPVEAVVDSYGNAVPFKLSTDQRLTVLGVSGSQGRTVTWNVPAQDVAGAQTVLAANGLPVGHMEYTISATDGRLRYVIRGYDTEP
ncbi:MAG TPA: hypothetical protein VFQ45_12665 [Longimicrobium sp.]|nr:hypothetical protein [Longimicrobium sp.]